MTEALWGWELVIVGKPPPRPGKDHWGAISKAKKRWAWDLSMLAKAKGIPLCEPGERRRVDVTFYRPGPESDKDNAYTGCKVPLDALVKAGLIEDDSPRHIDLHAMTVPGSPSRTTIRLSRIE